MITQWHAKYSSFFVALLLSGSLLLSSQLLGDDLSTSIVSANSKNLIQLLKADSDPNRLNENGLAPLLLAWQYGNLQAFEILLEMGANPQLKINEDLQIKVDGNDATAKKNSSILAVVVQNANLRPGFVEVCLRYMKLPKEVDAKGNTILHQMASLKHSHSNMNILKLMMIGGVDSNVQNQDGYSAVRILIDNHYASEDYPVLRWFVLHELDYFIAMGHDIQKTSPDKSSLLTDLAKLEERYVGSGKSHNESSTLVESLVLRTYPEQKEVAASRILSASPSPSLIPMFTNGPNVQADRAFSSPRKIEELLGYVEYVQMGGDINERGRAGFTHLWLAIHSYGNVDLFSWLLSKGADPDLRLNDDLRKFASDLVAFADDYFGVNGETVLMAACTNPYWRTNFVPPSLAVTKQPNQTDLLERNLLHRLLYHPLLNGQDHLINDLIRAGVNPNAQTISGATPLHVAVALNPKAIPILVQAGADPTVRNMRGQTVEDLLTIAIRGDWPRQEDYRKVLQWLIERRK